MTAVRFRRPGPALPWWKRLYLVLVRLNDSPGRIAGGVAIGVFVGVAPTFGAGLLLAAFLAALFRCNVAAAVVASAAGSPPLIFPVWFVSAWIGSLIFGLDAGALYAEFRSGSVWHAGGEAFKAYFVGNIIVTAVFTTLAYGVVLAVMRRIAAPGAIRRRSGSRARRSRPR